jgi:hypothetical protein
MLRTFFNQTVSGSSGRGLISNDTYPPGTMSSKGTKKATQITIDEEVQVNRQSIV